MSRLAGELAGPLKSNHLQALGWTKALPATGSSAVPAFAALSAAVTTAPALARGLPPPAAPLGSGRGLRRVSLAITMPIAAHSAASAINWVPTSRRSSGPTDAARAAAAPSGALPVPGLGVTAGMEGSSAPIFPPGLDVTGNAGTSGKEPLARPKVPMSNDPVPAAAPELEANELPAEGLAGTVTVIVPDAFSETFGVVLVVLAVSFTRSPLVLDWGMATAACSSMVCPELSVVILQVFVWPLRQTVKCGVADVGLVTSLTVTPPTFPPDADSQIAKYAVPPGFTFALPENTSTLSHNFTVVGRVAMNAISCAD